MLWSYWVVLALGVILAPVIRGDDSTCGESNRIIFRSHGNVSITGIFNAHEGDDCNELVGSGLEQAAAAIWAISILNQHHYLPGLQIGLTLFDGCNDNNEIKKSFVQALVLENCIKSAGTTTLGMFTTPEIYQILTPLASSLNQSVSALGSLLSVPSLLTMATQLLQEMSFNTVHRVIGDSQNFLNDFGRKMSEEGICIYDQVIIEDTHAINNEVLQPPDGTDDKLASSGPPVIFILAESVKIRSLFQNLGTDILKMSEIIWLVAPTDSAMEISENNLPNRTYILSAVVPKKEELDSFIRNPDVTGDPLNHRQPSKSPFFLSIASHILNILSPLQEIQNKSCNDANDTCLEVFEFLENLTSGKVEPKIKPPLPLSAEDITEVIAAYKISSDDEMFLFSVTEKYKSDDIAVFQIYDAQTFNIRPTLLIIKERRKRGIVRVGIEDIIRRGKENESSTSTTEETHIETVPTKNVSVEKHPCHEASGNLSSNCGICLNFVKYLSNVAQEKQMEVALVEVGWRFETWVGVNASVVAIGVLCALAVFGFVVARICLGDVLEGSPALSFFLLFAILIAYLATLPFSFHTTGTQGSLTLTAVICDLRAAGPPLSFSILFSILLSRSLMLAASDQDGGFMSHVNGYLQAVLIFFTCAVQFAISGEYWLFNSFLLNPSASCQAMYNTFNFCLLLSYDIFLLLLLMAVIPFMIRSKRNYKEGAFFSVAILVVFLLWATWIPLFFLLPSVYQDATVVLGLTGTATAILVFIFIPRTYLMTTAIVRDRIVNTLPPLIHSDHQFRSTQALYDTLNLAGKMGTPNPNFYAVNPTDSSPGTPQIQPGQYYSSDAGLKVPTLKRSVGRPSLRQETPEPAYEDFDSPVRTPRHVTRF